MVSVKLAIQRLSDRLRPFTPWIPFKTKQPTPMRKATMARIIEKPFHRGVIT